MARKSAVLIPAIIAAVAVGGLGVAFIPADLVGPERTELTKGTVRLDDAVITVEVADTAEREELPPILDYLERVVPEPGRFLVGEAISLADIAVASPFANLAHLNVEIDPERHRRTRAYVDSILSRPSFAPWIERETAFLAKEPA